jgi:hypothetical protein
MNPQLLDKMICCCGVLLMTLVAVAGFWKGNNAIAAFGVTGFTAFSGPLFMVMNREIGNSVSIPENSTGSATVSVEKKDLTKDKSL